MSITEVVVQGFDPSCEVLLGTDGAHISKGKSRTQVRDVEFTEVRVFVGGPGVDEQHKDGNHREEALEPHIKGISVERGLKKTSRIAVYTDTVSRRVCLTNECNYNDDNRELGADKGLYLVIDESGESRDWMS